MVHLLKYCQQWDLGITFSFSSLGIGRTGGITIFKDWEQLYLEKCREHDILRWTGLFPLRVSCQTCAGVYQFCITYCLLGSCVCAYT